MKHFFGRSFVVLLLFSFIVASIGVFTTAVFFNRYIEARLIREADDRVEAILDRLDSLEIEILRQLMLLEQDPAVLSLMFRPELTIRDVSMSLERVRSFTASNPRISELWVYNQLRQQFFSTIDGPVPVAEAPPYLYSFVRELRISDLFRLLPLVTAQGDRFLVMAVGQYPYVGREPSRFVLAVISPSGISEALTRLNNHDLEELYLLDNSGAILAGSPLPVPGQLQIPLPEDGTSVHQERLLVSRSIPNRELQLVLLRDISGFISPVRTLRNVNIALFLLCIAIVFIMIYGAWRNRYRPIEDLVRRAGAVFDDSDTTRSVTYSASIPSSLIKSTSVSWELETAVQSSILRPSVISDELLSQYLIDRGHDMRDLYATVLTLERLPRLIDAIGMRGVRQIRELIRRVFNSMTEACVLTADLEGNAVAALFHTRPVQSPTEVMAAVIAVISERLQCRVSAGLSEQFRCGDSVGAALRQAFLRGQFYFRQDADRIVGDDPVVVPFTYPSSMEEELRRCIIAGDCSGASEQINLIFDCTKQAHYRDFRYVVERLEHVLSEFFDSDFVFLELVSVPFETISVAKSEFHRIVRKATEEQGGHPSKLSSIHVEKAVQFMQEHLSNPALSSDMMADSVGLSKGYLRECFHEHLGSGPGAIITRTRLQKVGERLLESRESVKSIAFSLGFTNYNSFFGRFKNEFGMTPKEYRRKFSRGGL